MTLPAIDDIAARLGEGSVIPYLGPGMLALCPDAAALPADALALAEFLSSRIAVPHKIRKRATQAAQYIENFKHRKSLVQLLQQAYGSAPAPSALHRLLAASGAGLWVDSWYDDTFAQALAAERGSAGWTQLQGLSQSEHFGQWFAAYGADGGALAAPGEAPGPWLYKPLGGHAPAANYLASDADFVEVLTEIDIQTPIPPQVQSWRTGRSFLFLGCRFDDQLTRSFARQIMKRSSGLHWAVLPEPPTRMEARFLEEQQITRVGVDLPVFAQQLAAALAVEVA